MAFEYRFPGQNARIFDMREDNQAFWPLKPLRSRRFKKTQHGAVVRSLVAQAGSPFGDKLPAR
jgi:hypothetical protein